jgi:hypothetical protein
VNDSQSLPGFLQFPLDSEHICAGINDLSDASNFLLMEDELMLFFL